MEFVIPGISRWKQESDGFKFGCTCKTAYVEVRAECLGTGTLLISRFEVKSLGSAASTFQQSWWHRNWTFKFLLFLALTSKEFH